jgi:hypothetical protein
VTGVCGSTGQYSGTIKFVLSTTVTPSRGIISQPQLSQKVSVANGVNRYRFCASVLPHDLSLQLKSYVSACNCPDQYALYDVLVSKYNPNAGINDLVWRIRGGDATGILQLPQVSEWAGWLVGRSARTTTTINTLPWTSKTRTST